MKALVLSFIVLFVLEPASIAQQMPRTANVSPNLLGSVPQATPAGPPISLSMADAIDRALRYNLGTILSEQQTRVSRAARVRALSELLPKITGSVSESIQQINLAAFGFTGFSDVPPVVGPFSLFDARARYTQTVDFKLLHELHSAAESVEASSYGQQDVRELVVLITASLYLDAVAGSSRVDAARAQVRAAQAVFDRATNLKEGGVVPGIDVLRAQVQLQAQQQRVLAAQNELAKQKLNLARAIGLPLAQEFVQSSSFVTGASTPGFEEALATALENRADYRRAEALIRAADETRKAASSRRLPSFQFSADYGDIGNRPWSSHGTMGVVGTLLIPIYTGERARAEVLEADSLLEQRKAESANLRERIEYEVRAANLDIQSALEQVRVAQGARDLAQQALGQAQDRFAAGVTNGLEVTQAQQAVSEADENYISSVYALNIAQAVLARTMGGAEKSLRSILGGK